MATLSENIETLKNVISQIRQVIADSGIEIAEGTNIQEIPAILTDALSKYRRVPNEVITDQAGLGTIKENTVYIITGKVSGTLDLTTIETSHLETVIYFTTGDDSVSVNFPDGYTIRDSETTGSSFSAQDNTSYIITISDGVVVIGKLYTYSRVYSGFSDSMDSGNDEITIISAYSGTDTFMGYGKPEYAKIKFSGDVILDGNGFGEPENDVNGVVTYAAPDRDVGVIITPDTGEPEKPNDPEITPDEDEENTEEPPSNYYHTFQISSLPLCRDFMKYLVGAFGDSVRIIDVYETDTDLHHSFRLYQSMYSVYNSTQGRGYNLPNQSGYDYLIAANTESTDITNDGSQLKPFFIKPDINLPPYGEIRQISVLVKNQSSNVILKTFLRECNQGIPILSDYILEWLSDEVIGATEGDLVVSGWNDVQIRDRNTGARITEFYKVGEQNSIEISIVPEWQE